LALGHRAAATVGASTALISLLFNASLTAACLRGASAWFAIEIIARLGDKLLARTTTVVGESSQDIDGLRGDRGA
jgi:hypothetical protein